jgi:hypothetical protein
MGACLAPPAAPPPSISVRITRGLAAVTIVYKKRMMVLRTERADMPPQTMAAAIVCAIGDGGILGGGRLARYFGARCYLRKSETRPKMFALKNDRVAMKFTMNVFNAMLQEIANRAAASL